MSLLLLIFLAGCEEPAPPPDLPAALDGPAGERDAAFDPGRDLGAPDLVHPPDGGNARLRIMAANLTSGGGQSYDPGEGIRIMQGLKPDVVLLQEFNYRTNEDGDLRAFTDSILGPGAAYYREPGGQIPNGVLSRYPIRAAGVWIDPATSTRQFAWARLDVPGPKDLWAVSVHLLTASPSARSGQAQTLVSAIRAQVPAADYLVIGGDLNTDSRSEPCLDGLGQVVVVMAPHPADQGGNGNSNASRAKPYDWVLADADLHPLRVAVQIGAAQHTDGLVFDSRVYAPLAAVSPVRATDSSVSGMQHMAIVRDFVLPN